MEDTVMSEQKERQYLVKSNTQLESLILAQDERWRQA